MGGIGKLAGRIRTRLTGSHLARICRFCLSKSASSPLAIQKHPLPSIQLHAHSNKMIKIKWLFIMIKDLLLFGIANRAIGMSLAVLSFLFLGLVIIAVKVTAPFIYTLF